MAKKFSIIPAIDLMDGKCVQLQQGDPSKLVISIQNPVEVASKWERLGAKIIHIVDLNGAFEGKIHHFDLISKIREKVKCKLQVGGGIRSKKTIKELFEMGIDRVIIGTLAVKSKDFIRNVVSKFPNRIIIAVDIKKGKVTVEGWKKITDFSAYDLLKMYESCEVSFLFTNVDVEGLMKGSNFLKIKKIIKKTKRPVYIAGGISSKDEILKIKTAGARGVIIGSALYTGKLNFSELLELEE